MVNPLFPSKNAANNCIKKHICVKHQIEHQDLILPSFHCYIETYFAESFLIICISFLPSETWWYEPEADIHKLWLSEGKGNQT